MNELHGTMIDEILKHLNVFDRARLSFVSRSFMSHIYDAALKADIRLFFAKRERVFADCMRIVRRINTDGVVRGECLQCRSDNLLYTRNDGESETTVCLESCRFVCDACGHVTRARYVPVCCRCCRMVNVSYYPLQNVW